MTMMKGVTMGRKSRDKGARGEREFRDRLREMGINARRTYTAQAAGGGVPDLVTDNIRGTITWEVKRTKTAEMSKWLAQVAEQRKENPGASTVLAFRLDHGEWMYIGYLDDLKKTCKAICIYGNVEG